MKIFKELFSYFLIIIVVILLRSFIITPAQVVGNSMQPNLNNGDIILLNKISYRFYDINRFDIVVIKYAASTPLVKRVIGLPGEKVAYLDNKLYINNIYVKEPVYLKGTTDDYALDNDYIPDNYYFVVGDNRNNTIDSRTIGLIKREDIIGKTNYIIYPFPRLGQIERLSKGD
ncbi:MAG: signal peptidase I [Bacilli bacterium]|jgi:signal peptidase I|nr:signal peptidase I [Bacilli bacterium]